MLERDYKMVKKWIKPRGMSFVLVDEKEEQIIFKEVKPKKKVSKKEEKE